MVSVGFCMAIVGINKAIWYLWVAGLLLEAGALRTAPYTSTGGQ